MTSPNAEPQPVSAPDYAALSEKALITRCQKGDLEAFNILISRYEERVLNLTRRYLRDYHWALEEAQEVFLRVFKKIKTFRGQAAFATWLYRVTTNHCLNVLGRKKNHPGQGHTLSLNDEDCALQQQLPDPKAKQAEEEMLRDDLKNALFEALDHLPGQQRQVMVLYHFENFRYQEIAQIMDIPINQVSMLLYRGRLELKKIFQRGGRRHG